MNVHQPLARQDSAEAKSAARENVARIPTAPYREATDVVLSSLASDPAKGLTQTEARQRLDSYGPNQLKSAPETPWWMRLLEQFQNVLVIILLVAVVISMVEWLLQDPRESALPYEAIVILVIVAAGGTVLPRNSALRIARLTTPNAHSKSHPPGCLHRGRRDDLAFCSRAAT